MKIINAFWEKRNLNKDVIEIIIENDDTVESVVITVASIKCDYLVIKAPTGSFELNQALSQLGFLFVEHSISARNKLHDYHISDIFKRLLKVMDYELVTDENMALFNDNLNEGIFETDRIALDPEFSLKIANKRYLNWINDELEKQSKLYFALYKGEKVGFFLLQASDGKEVFAPVSGIFESYKHLKLGFCLNCLIHNAAGSLGYKFVKTIFTSNNRGAFSIHASQSYTLLEQFYVFVKHIE